MVTHVQRVALRLQPWFAAAAVLALFLACFSGPIIVERHFGIWFGLMGAVAAIACWVYIVPPMPGFVQGIVAIIGLASLLGLLLAFLIRAVRHLIH